MMNTQHRIYIRKLSSVQMYTMKHCAELNQEA